MPRRTAAPLTAFLLWTLFVWVGRIRNALTDDALSGWDRTSPLLLSLSFVVPALLLGLAWLVRSGGRGGVPERPLVLATIGLAWWTIAVWVVRAIDIALTSDRGAAFIAVHVVLAVVSITLAALAARAIGGSPVRSGAHISHGDAS